jgi:uncharacterized membrane protein
MKLMHFFRFTCHQDPARSFFIGKYQMPICARCFGIYIGYIIAIVLNACLIFAPVYIPVAFLTLMFIDWGNQNILKLYHSNLSRFISGICGGIGVVFIISTLILLI